MSTIAERLRPELRGLLTRLPGDPAATLPPELAAHMQDVLRAAFGREDLRALVRELLYLAAALERAGHASAAGLFALAEAREVLVALDSVNATRAKDSSERVVAGARRFADFAGAPRAPGPSARPSLPTLRLSALRAVRLAG